jgi:6-pyruvoyltetrahydropterin/6-carboxytetrahydropterin synthase
MVTDFKHLGWMKNFIDDVLDHKFIMDINDPLLEHEVPELVHHTFESGTGAGPSERKVLNMGMVIQGELGDQGKQAYWTPDLSQLSHLPKAVQEKYEGMVFVDFVPTSENLSAWLLRVAQHKMIQLGVEVVAVEFWETPKSHCRVDI